MDITNNSSLLFSQTNISNINFKNHLFCSATWRNLASNENLITEDYIEEYRKLAYGGTGLIFSGGMLVSDNKTLNGFIGIYKDSFVEDFKPFVKMIHSYSTNIVAQLACISGIFRNCNIVGKDVYGAGEIAYTMDDEVNIMTKDDISSLVKAYKDAAVTARRAGFDGVQIHSAHAYVQSSFLSSVYNKRTDEYGGSIENRARLLFEIVNSVRAATEKHFPIFVKINCSDFLDNGFTVDECIYVCEKLAELGVCMVELSGGNKENKDESWYRVKITNKNDESYFRNEAKKIAEKIDIPVILVGGNRSIDVMNQIAEESKVKFFSLSRPLLREPDLINKWSNNPNIKPKCISCNRCWANEGNLCVFNR
ncbi:MAG TPA: NADH:flavin oxidoreductase [Victivallales bacterium]|nr:NADH:flavin oxidoreductase [Victivallales bacterium]